MRSKPLFLSFVWDNRNPQKSLVKLLPSKMYDILFLAVFLSAASCVQMRRWSWSFETKSNTKWILNWSNNINISSECTWTYLDSCYKLYEEDKVSSNLCISNFIMFDIYNIFFFKEILNFLNSKEFHRFFASILFSYFLRIFIVHYKPDLKFFISHCRFNF